jgi:site-specific DNA-methyltransferase (adenine-specific)
MTVTLLQGDCLDILSTLPDKCADAIITDLPYGTTACKWDVVIPFAPMWEQVKRLCKGAFVTTSNQPFTSSLVTSNTKWFRYSMVWDKKLPTGHLDANRRPLRRHEDIVVFSQNGHTYNPQKVTRGKPRWKGGNQSFETGETVYHAHKQVKTFNNEYYPTTLIEVSNGDRTRAEVGFHPTQKPVALYEYLIKTYTNPGDTVLDFTAGSGTTGVAAIRTGRNAILIEREKKYFEIMQRRINEVQIELVA